MKSLAALFCFGSLCALPASAQSVSPDGETYQPARRIENFSWNAGVTVADIAEVTVLRDGNQEWAVETPMDCAIACEVFLGCVAFTYSEPQLFGEAPVCRMLSGYDGTLVDTHSHLYVKDAPDFGFTPHN